MIFACYDDEIVHASSLSLCQQLISLKHGWKRIGFKILEVEDQEFLPFEHKIDFEEVFFRANLNFNFDINFLEIQFLSSLPWRQTSSAFSSAILGRENTSAPAGAIDNV